MPFYLLLFDLPVGNSLAHYDRGMQMPAKKHSREDIVLLLKNLASRLGKTTLTKHEIAKEISPSTLRNYFGNMGNALEAAGLDRQSPTAHFADRGPQLGDSDLFSSIRSLENALGHEPGYNEYSAGGKFSVGPFRKRFGKWSNVLSHYRKWKTENPSFTDGDVDEVDTQQDGMPSPKQSISRDPARRNHAFSASVFKKTPDQLYGEPIDFRGLRHAPINEQGVVYLFGMVSNELGFYIESVQQGFPDCEGKFLYDKRKNLWAKARIEFEFRSSNFREHGHNPSDCDFIVCWIHDWPECPINVIELKSEILKLPSNRPN